MSFFLSPQTAAKAKTPSKAAPNKPAEKQTDSEPAAETATTSHVTAEVNTVSSIDAQTKAMDSKLTSAKVQLSLLSIAADADEAARRVTTRSKVAESKVTTPLAMNLQEALLVKLSLLRVCRETGNR